MRTLRNFCIRMSLSALAGAACCAAGAATPSAPEVTVTAATVGLFEESTPRRYVGMVEAINAVEIMPRVTGTMMKMNFKEGSMVQAGELLYELEDTTYRAAVEELEARIEQQQAALKYADSEFKRSQKLLASNAVAVSSHDKALFDMAGARAQLKSLGAALVNAKNTLSYTRIHAPLTGRIAKSRLTEGNLVTPQEGPLTDIVSIAPIYVKFSLSERVFRRDFGGEANIRKRARVRVLLADGSAYPEVANITLIDNKINASSNTITVWATFANRNQQLLPGGFVTVLVSVADEHPLPGVLPSALVAEDSGYAIFTLTADNRVERRAVQLGKTSGDYQLIVSGLSGGERVIIDGTHKVRPGMNVAVDTAAEAAPVPVAK